MKDKKLQEVLTEIREIAGMDAALFSDAAELLVAPFSDMNICGITRTFAQDVKTIFQIIGIM